jgi:hypothetical protein
MAQPHPPLPTTAPSLEPGSPRDGRLLNAAARAMPQRTCEPPTTLGRTVRGRSATARTARRTAPRAAFALLLCCLGCGSSVYTTPLNPAPRPLVPRLPESVAIFAGVPPTEPYVDFALLEVQRDADPNPPATALAIQRLREIAAQMGCDAVLVDAPSADLSEAPSATEPDLEGQLDPEPPLEPGSQVIHASCIVYTPAGSSRADLPTLEAATPR